MAAYDQCDEVRRGSLEKPRDNCVVDTVGAHLPSSTPWHRGLACFPAACTCISLPEDLSGLWSPLCPPLQEARGARKLTVSGQRPQTMTVGNWRTSTLAPCVLERDNRGTCSAPTLGVPGGIELPLATMVTCLKMKPLLNYSSLPTSVSWNCLSSKLTVVTSPHPALRATVKGRNQNWTKARK